MGWTFFERTTLQSIAAELIEQGGPRGFKCIDHARNGNELYCLFVSCDDPNTRFIRLYLIASGGRANPGSWGYKAMDEACLPYYFKCPERLLAQSTCNEPEAIRWRQACRDARANARTHRRFLEALRPGDMFRYCDKQGVFRGLEGRYVIGLNAEGQLRRFKSSGISPVQESPPTS